MPEGPIIVILKEQVQQFKGKKVIVASSDKSQIKSAELIGKTVTDFKSWGKHFLMCFGEELTVRIHLMMFGSYRINEHSDKKPRLHLEFADGELNFYACSIVFITQPLDEVYDWTEDIMNESFHKTTALKKLKENPSILACDALLDQHLFSGSGNIIKNEVLFRTRIHPESLIGKIPDTKLKELIEETVNYAFEFLEWKQKNTLKKHWLAYSKSICPRDKVAFNKQDTGKTHRRSFFCNICEKRYT